jgi:hypothetical protein
MADGPQARVDELTVKAAEFYSKDTIRLIAEKLHECDGAMYGPHFDTAHVVLGALVEAEGRD